MDLGIVLALFALAMGTYTIWSNWRSDNSNRRSFEEMKQSFDETKSSLQELRKSSDETKEYLADVRSQREREANRVDGLIKTLNEVVKNLSRGND